jgi:hypothetical protein
MTFTIDAQPHSIQFTDENGEVRLEADVARNGNPEIGMSLYDGRRAVEIYMSPAEALRLSSWLAARGMEGTRQIPKEPAP